MHRWAVREGFFASIPKFGPEIKNRCTQERVNGENLASILKSGPEIKNRCITREPGREYYAVFEECRMGRVGRGSTVPLVGSLSSVNLPARRQSRTREHCPCLQASSVWDSAQINHSWGLVLTDVLTISSSGNALSSDSLRRSWVNCSLS